MTSVKEITSLCRQNEVIEDYNKEIDRQVHRNHGWNILTSIFYAISQGTVPLCVGLQVWYGSKLLKTGEITIYQFYITFSSLVITAQAVQTMFSFGPEMNLGKDATASISKLLDTIPDMDECATDGISISDNGDHDTQMYGISDDAVMGKIEFRNVNFRYAFQPEHNVLRDVSFTLNPGDLTALMSIESGCDREAILELIERFYKPLKGDIYMDGINIKSLNLANYRRIIGYVNAKSAFVEGLSVRENIMLGWGDHNNLEIDESTLVKACKVAKIHDFIMGLPDGYNTSGEIVYMPSQKIRIALARAILREPKVLLIDDVLSPYGESLSDEEIETVKKQSNLQQRKDNIICS